MRFFKFSSICLLIPGLFCCGEMVAQANSPSKDNRHVIFFIPGPVETSESVEKFRDILVDIGLSRTFRVEPVYWKGPQHRINNYYDGERQLTAGIQLAYRIQTLRQEFQARKMYLVAFGTGTRIALAAAERVSPSAIERMIFMGSTVSVHYPISKALRGSRQGLDNFYSKEDHILEHFEELRGTSDRKSTATAGRYGFAPAKEMTQDPHLSNKLRQYSWELFRRRGGHIGWSRIIFLRHVVLPMVGYPYWPQPHP